MKRTIRLGNEYQLAADGSVLAYRLPSNYDDPNDHGTFNATQYEVGARAVLVSDTDVSPNALRAGTRAKYRLCFDIAGVGGNSNPHVKRTTGWRGTTNDRSLDAHGIVTIRKIRALKNGRIAVTVS